MLNINRPLNKIISNISRYSPWTNVFGLSRSLLAMGTFLTLFLNSSNILFPGILPKNPLLNNLALYKWCYFEVFNFNLEIARYIALAILFLVIIGYRPRYTAFFHFWIALSFLVSTETPDGGDQVAAILSLFFMPIALLDNRKWHWDNPKDPRVQNFYSKAFCFALIIGIRVQVSIIYLHAATAKFHVKEWINGTALWYWFNDPVFGSNYWVNYIVQPLIKSAYTVTLITWGSLILELFLFTGLVMSNKNKKYLLIIGLSFHFSILIIQGLGSFFFSMAAALIIYLRPVNNSFTFQLLKPGLSEYWHKSTLRAYISSLKLNR